MLFIGLQCLEMFNISGVEHLMWKTLGLHHLTDKILYFFFISVGFLFDLSTLFIFKHLLLTFASPSFFTCSAFRKLYK